MPGRIIDIIALREDFDPWLPNIEKNINYEIFFLTAVHCLAWEREKKKTWPSWYQPIAYV